MDLLGPNRETSHESSSNCLWWVKKKKKKKENTCLLCVLRERERERDLPFLKVYKSWVSWEEYPTLDSRFDAFILVDALRKERERERDDLT